jgi:quinol monooxygenase YgiN
MEICVLVTFTTLPEKRKAFADLLTEVRAQLPRVAGCKSVRVFDHPTTSGTFTLLETWESEAVHKAHLDQVIQSGAWEHILGHLSSPPHSSYCVESI